MGLFEQFPYSNFHELNLDWLLNMMKKLSAEMDTFVNVNTIKYADPLQWDISRQYEPNTLVQTVDGYTYLSKKAVPVGISVDNPEFWLKVADFSAAADTIRENIAAANEGNGKTASASRALGDLVWLAGNLYKIIAPMIAGDSYVSGSNCEKVTVEELLHALEQAVQEEATAREQAVQMLQEDISDLITEFVDVKKFGAVGNAKYYNIADKKFYQNAEYSIEPTSDVDAVNAAIQYALDHNITTVFFPAGYYYLPHWNYNLDINKLRFVGVGESVLCSAGLSGNNAFITLSSPLRLDNYNTAKTPLQNISLWGAYNDGETTSGVIGLRFSAPTDIVACHCSFSNVVIKDFNIGLYGGQLYKTIWYNLSVVACGVGIYLENISAIPVYFIGGFVECCAIGLYDEGVDWAQCVFYGFAFEYNRRQLISGSGRNIFNNCRFESDPRTTPVKYWVFDCSGDTFETCDILLIPNYADNVRNWIHNPERFVKPTVDASIFINKSGNTTLENCKFGLDRSISVAGGFYIISGSGIGVVNCVATYKPSNFINESTYRTIEQRF